MKLQDHSNKIRRMQPRSVPLIAGLPVPALCFLFGCDVAGAEDGLEVREADTEEVAEIADPEPGQSQDDEPAHSADDSIAAPLNPLEEPSGCAWLGSNFMSSTGAGVKSFTVDCDFYIGRPILRAGGCNLNDGDASFAWMIDSYGFDDDWRCKYYNSDPGESINVEVRTLCCSS